VARGMAELLSMTGQLDRGSAARSISAQMTRVPRHVWRSAAHAGPAVDLSLPDVRTAHADRSGDIAEIAVRLGAEVDGHQITGTKPSARHRCVGMAPFLPEATMMSNAACGSPFRE